MENITEFYQCPTLKQPVKYRIIKYVLDLKNEVIQVEYLKEVYNQDMDVLLNTIKKSYQVKDFEDDPQYTNWRFFVPSELTMEQIFYGNTIPKILFVNGLENADPIV